MLTAVYFRTAGRTNYIDEVKQMKALLCQLAAMSCLLSTNVFADVNGVVGMNEKVVGKSLPEYTNLWWQWASSMPAIESPVRDQTGLKCDVNQKGQVWFLAGGYGSSKISRKCSIPKDRYLFFPVINMINFPNGESKMTCEEAKARTAMNNDNLRSFVVTIDEHKIVNPVFHRYSSPNCFDLLGWPPKNEYSPIVYPSATDGYWVMLQPLPRGKHKLSFSAEYHNPDQTDGMMIQDIEYQIEIVESDKQPPQLKLIENDHRPVNKGI